MHVIFSHFTVYADYLQVSVTFVCTDYDSTQYCNNESTTNYY